MPNTRNKNRRPRASGEVKSRDTELRELRRTVRQQNVRIEELAEDLADLRAGSADNADGDDPDDDDADDDDD